MREFRRRLAAELVILAWFIAPEPLKMGLYAELRKILQGRGRLS